MRNKAENFGTRLRRIRNERRETQEVFAQRGGVTQRSQANYEKGVRIPRIDYLQRLAESDIDVAYLLTGEGSDGKLTCEEQQLIRAIRKHDIDKHKEILKAIAAICSAFR